MSRERPPAQASARSFGARSLRTQSALRGQGETGPAQTAPRPPQPTLQSPRKARGYLGPSRDPGAGPAGGGLSRHDLCPKLKPMPRYADAKGRSACSRCPQRSVVTAAERRCGRALHGHAGSRLLLASLAGAGTVASCCGGRRGACDGLGGPAAPRRRMPPARSTPSPPPSRRLQSPPSCAAAAAAAAEPGVPVRVRVHGHLRLGRAVRAASRPPVQCCGACPPAVRRALLFRAPLGLHGRMPARAATGCQGARGSAEGANDSEEAWHARAQPPVASAHPVTVDWA